jgi:hypothetical protein
MFSEGIAAHSVGSDSPLQIVIAVWPTFFKNLNLLRWVWQPAADSNGRLMRFKFEKRVSNGNYYQQRAVTPYQIPQQNCLQRPGGP